MRRAFTLSYVSPLALTVLLAGCAVGPDFIPPQAPEGAEQAQYDSTPTPDGTADGVQKFIPGRDVPAQWWGVFHSDALNALIKQAIDGNPDLAAAQASLRVAQDNLDAGSSALFPTIGGSLSSQRAQTSKYSGGATSIYTLHNTSVNVSYNLDVWGGTRRQIESLQAKADSALFEKEATYLTLTGNVVTAAITDASLREQIAAAQSVIDDQEKTLKIIKARFESGAVAKSALLQQQSALATAKAALPVLQHQLTVNRHALSALVGKLPVKDVGAQFELSALTLPPEVPLAVPSKLLAQRPDLRQALENLHAASAEIGVAEAARLPQVTLSADIGTMANLFDKLFSPGGGFWAWGGSASQTLFDARALADKEEAARDTFAMTAEQYRKTVIAAFKDVADTLHALQSDADVLVAKTEAEKSAAEALALAQAQFAAGATSAADLLSAQVTAQQAKSALAAAKAQRYADTAALYVALGGDWWRSATDAQTSSESQTPAEKDSK